MPRLTKKQREENLDRAERGRTILDEYVTITRDDGSDALIDLLADLMHYAKVNGCDFDGSVETARMHFDSELLGVL